MVEDTKSPLCATTMCLGTKPVQIWFGRHPSHHRVPGGASGRPRGAALRPRGAASWRVGQRGAVLPRRGARGRGCPDASALGDAPPRGRAQSEGDPCQVGPEGDPCQVGPVPFIPTATLNL